MTEDDIERRAAAIAAEAEPSREGIHELCQLALDPDQQRRSLAAWTLFTSIVERLSDGFDPGDVAIYDRVFAQVIDECRRSPEAQTIHDTLLRFGIQTEDDVMARKLRLARPKRFDPSALKRILILSRVTLGADVSVTSVIVNALASTFPGAAIALIGAPPIADLYDSSGSLQILDAAYARRGGILDRLRSWTDLVSLIDAECHGLAAEEYLVVDPDSRLTQLGLLPVVEDETRYLFFESRGYGKQGNSRLAELTAIWCAEAFGAAPGARPFVHLANRHLEQGRRAVRFFRDRGARVAAFNFGVGGNESKRLDLEFETQLALGALARGYGLILDKGVGEECERVNRIVARLRSTGRIVCELDDAAAPDDPAAAAQVITWQGGPGAFAGLIASADLYLGYDSAFQHVAAALGVPVIDLFVRQENERFIARWTPYSQSVVHVLRMDPSISSTAAAGDVLRLITETEGNSPQSPREDSEHR